MKEFLRRLSPSRKLDLVGNQIKPMPIIVGAPRSGTTLLRLMVDAHREIAIPPETGFAVAVAQLENGEMLRSKFLETVTQFPVDAPNWQDVC